MDNPYEPLNESVVKQREASKTERCHTIPHHGGYSVGQHSYDMLTMMLALHPKPTMNLVKAIVYHDTAERWVGDSPSSIKEVEAMRDALEACEELVNKGLGISVKLTKADKAWLKALDAIEFMLWCQDQLAMGNHHVQPAYARVQTAIGAMELPEEVKNYLTAQKWYRTGP